MDVLTGDEYFTFDAMPTGYMLRDFWAWNSSDLLNNTMRGALAEFIVASTLNSGQSDAESMNLNFSKPRTDWDAYDLLYPCTDWPEGVKIEVKSAAYLQSWEQNHLSRIQFSIRPTRSWTSTEGYSDEIVRQSDLYVFCLFSCKDRNAAFPLNLDQWEFYVLRTSILDEQLGSQETLSFSTLLTLNPIKSDYDSLFQSVIYSIKTYQIAPPLCILHNFDTNSFI